MRLRQCRQLLARLRPVDKKVRQTKLRGDVQQSGILITVEKVLKLRPAPPALDVLLDVTVGHRHPPSTCASAPPSDIAARLIGRYMRAGEFESLHVIAEDLRHLVYRPKPVPGRRTR
jgi:hypothetical protein